MHPVGQEAEIGLMHAQHILHRLGGDADFLADDTFAILAAQRKEFEADRIGIIHGQRRILFDQRRQRPTVAQRFIKGRSILAVDAHKYPPS